MNFDCIFTSNMVFAANKPIKIFGNGYGNASLSFAGQCKTVSSVDNKWLVEFPPMEYGGPYELKLITDDTTTILEDIYIGEVFLMAGQSNIQFKLHESADFNPDCQGDERIRLFSTYRIEDSDAFNPSHGWRKAVTEEIGNWSALIYLIAKEYIKSQDIHLGFITCYQGASVIESWVPAGSFESIGINLPLSDKHYDHTEPIFADWNGDGKLYEFALSQVIPFELSGVVWYQGESDTSIPESLVYKKELAKLIEIWRNDFSDKTLPFVIIQIADYDARDDEGWKNLQKAQYEIQYELENVATVISADVSESNDIHPPTKGHVAIRVANELNTLLHS